MLVFLNYRGLAGGILAAEIGNGDSGHAGGAVEGRDDGEVVRQGRGRGEIVERGLDGGGDWDGGELGGGGGGGRGGEGGGGGGVEIVGFAVGVIGERGAGVLEGHGVEGVGGG